MTLRTSYILGLIACTTVGFTSLQLIDSAHAETLNITGPNGEVKQQAKRQYGPTTSRDTFWSIAQKVRPNDRVSVYQVMAALFDANPHAFSGNNYNTLERGMILLIPSAEVMAAIPDSVARRRAEQDDRQISRPAPVTPQPVVTKPSAIVEVVKKPNADKPLQIVQKTPAVEVQTQALKQANAAEVNDLNSVLDKANAKTLMLTDELARAQDELMVSNNDNQVLKNKIEQMSLNISSLEEDLQLLSEKHDKLRIEYEKLLQQVDNKEPVVEAPADFWRSLTDNTMLLIVAASVPLLLLFGLIFWLLTRRKKAAQQTENEITSNEQTETVAKQAGTAAALDEEDNADDVVIHLDSDDDESIDDLLNLDSAELQPEASMADDSEMDMASEMFVGEDTDDDEGSSLDDLWAEAMEEQDSELEPLDDDDDLDSLLAGLDDLPASTVSSVAPEDDLDSLFDSNVANDDDIDSLLAEFDMPAETETEQAKETDDEPEFSQDLDEKSDDDSNVANDDDIDSLLAEFDMPAETETEQVKETDDEPESSEDLNEESAEESDDDSNVANDDDIDSLLAEFDMPAETETEQAKETDDEPEFSQDLDEESAEESDDDSIVAADDAIDSLLAEFDMPADTDAEPESEVSSETDEMTETSDRDELLAELEIDDSDDETSDDDIDALLAELEASPDEEAAQALNSETVNEQDDIAALIAAELQDEDDIEESTEADDQDIDALLASLNEPVIDSSVADISTAEEAPVDDKSEDLSEQIAAELADESDETETLSSGDDDIDALLAGFEQDDDEDDITAQIADELDDIDDDATISADVTESSDEDIDALLASFDEPEIAPTLNLDEQDDATQTIDPNEVDDSSDVDDQDLFNELDEYLSDLDNSRSQADAEHDKTFFDPGLDALLVESNSTESADETDAKTDDTIVNDGTEASDDELEFSLEAEDLDAPLMDDISDEDAEDELNALLASMGDDDVSLSLDDDAQDDESTPNTGGKANKDSGFFNDLKANKPKPAMLDWESDLLKAAETAVDEQEPQPTVSDDDLLAAFSQSLTEDDGDNYTSEDDYLLNDDNLTVDEALAALDENERSKSAQYSVSDDDLMSFERENGYIDIDKLLNDADENIDKTDQYKDVDVDVGEVNSLIGNADMVDVDDEENSVNAKLDLARAYIEIEDQDSAKALLKEVQIDGNDRQKAEAASLLKGF